MYRMVCHAKSYHRSIVFIGKVLFCSCYYVIYEYIFIYSFLFKYLQKFPNIIGPC